MKFTKCAPECVAELCVRLLLSLILSLFATLSRLVKALSITSCSSPLMNDSSTSTTACWVRHHNTDTSLSNIDQFYVQYYECDELLYLAQLIVRGRDENLSDTPHNVAFVDISNQYFSLEHFYSYTQTLAWTLASTIHECCQLPGTWWNENVQSSCVSWVKTDDWI